MKYGFLILCALFLTACATANYTTGSDFKTDNVDQILARIKGNEQNFVKDDLFSAIIKTTKKHRTGNSPIYSKEVKRILRHRTRPEAKIIKDNE
ncbi:hypothetical protein CWC17_12995 [Pseudoalteromonas sp. S3785]|uniref:hypothetical protein n=1 Tax=Pseudoalteromonas sp. S3785 TaxID=579545 RepID=UPI00110BB7DE|nr:hypothetical protein [Pseudoalteromonas sp. S3785]TMO72736.1 hypothetical protein CWC17_12995 [Pseudoalteromonas sp. S3785]